MKDFFTLEVSKGTLRCIYQEGIEEFAEKIGAKITKIGRASFIEWQSNRTGGFWVVRSANNSRLAIRTKTAKGRRTALCISKVGPITKFKSKVEALYWEEQFFWPLLRGETSVKRKHH